MTDSLPVSPAMRDSLLASMVKYFVDIGVALGMERQLLLATAGLTEQQLAQPETWIPVSHVVRLVHAALAFRPDAILGLRQSQHIDPAAFGVVGLMLHVSGNLNGAIQALQRYEPVIGDLGRTVLEFQPGMVLWCWQCSATDPLFRRHAIEYVLGVWTTMVRLLRPEQHVPLLLAVHLPHQSPEDGGLLADYEAVFGCPVLFGQSSAGLLLELKTLHRPSVFDNPGLSGTLEPYARQLLDYRQQGASLTAQVKARLRVLLAQGNASRVVLAQQLNKSERSLSRQLQHEGSSYRDILDDLRFELARQYLRESSPSVEAVSQRLGFQESQSFIRWFRQLADCTPGEYMKAFAAEA